MANVQEWVAKIRAAVYGKDVRESIAASIEAINDECEEATSGYEDAISQAQEALQASVQASTLAGVAAGSANTAADRANEAAERVEDTDVSQLVQRIKQLTPETVLFWEYEESSGSGRIEAYASACGGMVEYYAVLFGTFTADTYTGMLPEVGSSQGEMTLLETLGSQYIPALNTIGTAPTQESYAAAFTGNSGLEESPATIQLNFLRTDQVSMQSINVDLNGHRSYLVPNVIYLGKCKSQAES